MLSNIFLYGGLAVALLGIGLLVRCILKASRIRASQIEPGRLEAELRGLILMNGAAVGIGFFGLAMMVVGFTI
jgi:hypothetical protein